MTQLEQRFYSLVPQYLKEINDNLKTLIDNLKRNNTSTNNSVE